MKLQLAEIFGEHMVLQRNKKIPVWGISVKDDTVHVSLGTEEKTVSCVNGEWMAEFEPREACERISFFVSSEKTGEQIRFLDCAIGEVWLCGGQSNMEFLLKYDSDLAEACAQDDDPLLRYYCCPQLNFAGAEEKTDISECGFWRCKDTDENRKMFGAIPYWMGCLLREKLGVPVGMIACNWGGTPAAAWASMEELQKTEPLKLILDWQKEMEEKLDWKAYYAASEKKVLPVSEAEKAGMENFMMGIGLKEFFDSMEKNGFPPLPVYTPYVPGPRACIRPAGLYETMLKKAAPYALRGFIWYQGEDDDARDWQDIYDESMKAVIRSWRKLWQEELPFFQVELAPFAGRSLTAAKKYPLIRSKQHQAAMETEGVHNICIMDLGDDLNIHFRNKKKAGERLALLAEKYAYGFPAKADSPELETYEKSGSRLYLTFSQAGEGLIEKGGPEEVQKALEIRVDGKKVTDDASMVKTFTESVSEYQTSVNEKRKNVPKGRTACKKHHWVIECSQFEEAREIEILYLQKNYCQAVLFDHNGLPAFPFTLEWEAEE